jgi:4-hydroxy-3-polyprenylbenzoate decarboxylase
VIVTDDDIDVTVLDELIWAALTRADPVTDIDFIRNTWTSPADPRVTPEDRAKGNLTNSRMIIDACRPWHWRDRFSPATKASAESARIARDRFGFLLE